MRVNDPKYLYAYYNFNSNSSEIMNNLSGTATNINYAKFIYNDKMCGSFAGSSTINTGTNFLGSIFSINCLVYPGTFGAGVTQGIIMANGDLAFGLGSSGGNFYGFLEYNAGSTILTSNTVNSPQWMQLGLVVSGNTANLYLNGETNGSQAFGFNKNGVNGGIGSVNIAGSQAGLYGLMADLMFHKINLTGTEMKYVYLEKFPK